MTDVTLEQNLAIKEAIEWGYEYHSNQLNELGYTHRVKDNEIEIYDTNGTFVGKSFLAKEKQVSTRTFEAATIVPPEIADLSNELLFDKISLGYTVRDIEKHLHESQLDNIQADKIVFDSAIPYLSSTDPHLTSEHVWKAKAAARAYCDPILEGEKKGLWKSFRDFKKHGVFEITGTKVDMKNNTITEDGWKQLATALAIYRDKRFETFRYLFISDDGVVKDQLAISSQLPGLTKCDIATEKLIAQAIAHAESTNTKIVVVHNHPSGNTVQSIADEITTKDLEKRFTNQVTGETLFKGHIILDHDTFNLYENGKWDIKTINNSYEKDPIMKTRNPMADIVVNQPSSLQAVAEAINSRDNWKEKGWMPIVFVNTQARVSAVKMYPESFLEKNNQIVLKELQKTAVQVGAVMTFPIITDSNIISLDKQKELFEKTNAGCFTDFYIGNKNNYKTAGDFNLQVGHEIFNQMLKNTDEMDARTSIKSTFKKYDDNQLEEHGIRVCEPKKLSYKSKIPEKLLSPSQIKAGQDVNPLTQKFMASNSFFPPMTIAKNGNIILHCSSQDLKGNKEPSITPVEIVLTPKQVAVLVDTSIKCQFVENRQSKQPTPLNLATKNKMEESFYLGLKTVHPQLSISEAEKQYNKVYSLIEKELKEFRLESREQQKPVKNKASMEW